MQHGVDDQVGVLEAALTRGQEVLVGELDVLLVEPFLSVVVQFLPDVTGCFQSDDVGGLAEVSGLDDAHLEKKGEERAKKIAFYLNIGFDL